MHLYIKTLGVNKRPDAQWMLVLVLDAKMIFQATEIFSSSTL